MPFNWAADWDSAANNNGASMAQIIHVLGTANLAAQGDAGLKAALIAQSNTVTIEKGIHDPGPHIRVFYLGGTWHVHLLETAAGGPGGYRVSDLTQ